VKNLLEQCKREVRHKYPPKMDEVDKRRWQQEALEMLASRCMNELMTGFLNEMELFMANRGNAYGPAAQERIAETLHSCTMGMCINRLLHNGATQAEIAAELECNPAWSVAAFKAWNTMYARRGGRRKK
jgi:hypothetical protein